MEITTKYNINDEVWFVHPLSQKAVCGRVNGINIKVGGKAKYRTGEHRDLIKTGEYEEQRFTHTYTIDDQIRKEGITKTEHELFINKDELKQRLMSEVENL